MYKSAARTGGAFWIAAGIKGTIAVTSMGWKGVSLEEETLPQ